MNYICNINLSILTYLLLGKEVLFKVRDKESKAQLITFCSVLTSNFPCVECKNVTSGIKVTCNDFDQLRAFLKEYCNLYCNGELVEENNSFESLESLNCELIKMAEDLRTNKKRYIIDKTKFTPLILARYLENNEFIKDMNISLAPEGDMPYPMELYEYNPLGECIYARYWQDYFISKYTLDMEWYLSKFNANTSKTKKDKKCKHYPKQQQKLLDVITDWAISENEYKIHSDRLFSRAKLIKLKQASKDMAISRLNEYYRNINNTNIPLLKKNKNTDCYEISKEFILITKTND